MLALIAPVEQRDVIGDAVVWAASRQPAADELLDRYCQNGKIGPVPLGIAAGGALALLLLVATQVFAAVVVFVGAVVIYLLPKLGAALTASERANLRLTRVTGMARLQRTPDAVGRGLPRLLLSNDVELGLQESDFNALTRFGWPAVAQRPVPGSSGVRDDVLWYDLPGVTVNYLAPNNLLMDVRGPDAAVLYRRPPYEGEPGDRVLSPDIPAASSPHPAAPESAPGWQAPSAPQVTSTAPPSSSRATVSVLPLPLAAQVAMQEAAKSAAIKAAILGGGGIVALVVLSQLFGGLGFFWVVVVIMVVIGNFNTIGQALKLSSARSATTMTRVTGQATMTYHTCRKQASQYRLILDNGAILKIDSELYTRLTYEGEVLTEHDAWGFNFGRNTDEGYLRSEYRIPSVTVTYEPNAAYLLEIVNPFGAKLYRAPALNEGDLGPTEPRV
jgi:hypothetical protein